MDADGATQAVKYYREYYSDRGMLDCTLYDGITEAIAALKGMNKKIILATSKPEVAAVRIIEHFGLSKYFDYLAGASSDTSRVQKADVIAYAMQSAGITAARTVMVGDRRHDAEGAKANGIKCIGVLYGYGSKTELISAGADYIAETPKEIVSVIEAP